jgi:hypothetical protein
VVIDQKNGDNLAVDGPFRFHRTVESITLERAT